MRNWEETVVGRRVPVSGKFNAQSVGKRKEWMKRKKGKIRKTREDMVRKSTAAVT